MFHKSDKKRNPSILLWLGLAAMTGIVLVFLLNRDHVEVISNPEEPHHGRNVILIVVDTLRADHLSCYGYSRPTTPHIDRLASRGALFANAFCNINLSIPSFATIFTSLYPNSHKLENSNSALSPEAITLAEILRDNGWETAAILGAVNLHHAFGLNQGFQFYEDQIGKRTETGKSSRPISTSERRAEEVNELAFHWLDHVRKPQKFFLMIHYFDPHYRYDPPPPFHTMYVHAGSENSRTTDLYDGEVSYVDQQIGRIMDKLASLGLRQNSLIIITSDHGEALGDHRAKWHGKLLFDEQVHVPLIFVGPEIPAGSRIPALVQHVDLAPTILDYLKVPIPSIFQGVSFLPTLSGKTTRRYVLLEGSKHKKRSYGWAVRTETEKFIWSANGNHRLYDLKRDPEELHNLYKPQQGEEIPFFIEGRKFRSGVPVYKLAKPPQPTSDFEPDEALKALGYVQ